MRHESCWGLKCIWDITLIVQRGLLNTLALFLFLLSWVLPSSGQTRDDAFYFKIMFAPAQRDVDPSRIAGQLLLELDQNDAELSSWVKDFDVQSAWAPASEFLGPWLEVWHANYVERARTEAVFLPTQNVTLFILHDPPKPFECTESGVSDHGQGSLLESGRRTFTGERSQSSFECKLIPVNFYGLPGLLCREMKPSRSTNAARAHFRFYLRIQS